jgi:5'-nucleotidase
MLILITNDDGIKAPALFPLKKALDTVAETLVFAPDHNWSAAGHTKTMHKPLRITEDRLEEGLPLFITTGTPSDCVGLALLGVVPERPDLVVSGINFGANMGDDVHYSGTVSAAFEAAILGVPALAVSQVIGKEFSFVHAGRFARLIAGRILERGLPSGTLLNVNIPPRAPRGVRFTRLGKRVYTEGVVEDTDPRGRKCYWIGGGDPVWEDIPGTDFAAVGAGYISVTPLQLDMTDRVHLAALETDGARWDLEGA